MSTPSLWSASVPMLTTEWGEAFAFVAYVTPTKCHLPRPDPKAHLAKPRDDASIADAEAAIANLTREARDLAAKAKELEDGVYDLKAVNPHRKPDLDTRTPDDLLALIDAKGREIADALAPLRAPPPR